MLVDQRQETTAQDVCVCVQACIKWCALQFVLAWLGSQSTILFWPHSSISYCFIYVSAFFSCSVLLFQFSFYSIAFFGTDLRIPFRLCMIITCLFAFHFFLSRFKMIMHTFINMLVWIIRIRKQERERESESKRSGNEMVWCARKYNNRLVVFEKSEWCIRL